MNLKMKMKLFDDANSTRLSLIAVGQSELSIDSSPTNQKPGRSQGLEEEGTSEGGSVGPIISSQLISGLRRVLHEFLYLTNTEIYHHLLFNLLSIVTCYLSGQISASTTKIYKNYC